MTRAENREALKQFIGRIYREFGRGFGQTIILAFFEELGGMRITVPTIKELAQEDRDRRIRLQFNGVNYVELAARWGLSDRQVRRIVNRT